MGKKKRENRKPSAELTNLEYAGIQNTKLVENFVNKELHKVLRERNLDRIEIERAIFSHLKSGVVVSGPVCARDTSADSAQDGAAFPVGFLVNTMRLVDPVSRRALNPGVSLVEMRTLRDGNRAFDYIGGDGKVKMATDTDRCTRFGNPSGLGNPEGSGSPDAQHFDIEVNHVIIAPTPDDLLPCDTICTSFHDGTEKCHYACLDGDDLGFTIID